MHKSKHARRPKKPSKPVIVELDPDGDGWLRTGKKARRRLTREEFMRLVENGSVIIKQQNN